MFTIHRELDALRLYPLQLSLDTEYSQKDIKVAYLQSISIGIGLNECVILSPAYWQEHKELIEYKLNKADVIYTQNGGVDWYMLKKHGISVDRSKFVDAMLLEHLIDENVRHGLGEMAVRYFGDNYKAEFWGKYPSYDAAPKEEQDAYEARDACYTLALGRRFHLQVMPALARHVHDLYWALFDSEIRGLKVDVDLMQETKRTMGAEVHGLEAQVREDFKDYCDAWEMERWEQSISRKKSLKGKANAKRPGFNVGSDTQLRWLVYDKDTLACEVRATTKTGLPAMDAEALQMLLPEHPYLQPIVDYKEIKVLYSTFVEGLIARVQDGRIYPHFNANGTRNAGRISHSRPNMANMPSTGPFRSFFVPEPGNRIVGADYSQLEVVIEANLTHDKQLLKIIHDGASKHDITAQGLGLNRDLAKKLNFALQYGATPYKVAEILGIPNREAQTVYDAYWKLYSGVKALKDQVAKQIEGGGYVETLFGRRRHFPKALTDKERGRYGRQAYNALIQGTGGDCTNRAFYRWANHIGYRGMGHAWFSVHDEIASEIVIGYWDIALVELPQCMEEVNEYLKLKYPIKAKAYGPLERWGKG